LLVVAATAGCIVDDWRYRAIDVAVVDVDVARPTDEDVIASPDADVPASPDADVPASPDADVTAALDADALVDASDDVRDGFDADASDAPDGDARSPDVPPPDAPSPPGVVVRGGIAPAGAHVSATVRVRGTLSFGSRHCNATGTTCFTGGISP
jgi:hypothetical protein